MKDFEINVLFTPFLAAGSTFDHPFGQPQKRTTTRLHPPYHTVPFDPDPNKQFLLANYHMPVYHIGPSEGPLERDVRAD
jgi:hypothetical protein